VIGPSAHRIRDLIEQTHGAPMHRATQPRCQLPYAAVIVDDESASGPQRGARELEEQEDEHVYHTKGSSRELWIGALGMPAVLPPPEEEKDREDRDWRRARRWRGER
jgi:hypothetical protein